MNNSRDKKKTIGIINLTVETNGNKISVKRTGEATNEQVLCATSALLHDVITDYKHNNHVSFDEAKKYIFNIIIQAAAGIGG